MRPNEAVGIARHLMTTHGVGHIPFSFHDYPAQPRIVGRCHFVESNKIFVASKITVCIEWAQVMENDDFRNVVLHEIAHAKAGKNPVGGAHGPVWQKECVKLGISHNAFYRSNNIPERVMASL